MKLDVRYGKNILASLSEGEFTGPVVALTRENWRGPAESRLAGRLESTLLFSDMTGDALDALAEKAAKAGAVVAVGDGPVMDAARYVAWRTGSKLVMAPMAITGESAVSSGVWTADGGRTTILGQKAPDLVTVDLDLIWNGPEHETRAGVGDVLGIVTATEDCFRASRAGAAEFDGEKALEAMEIVNELMDRADDLFDLTEAGVRKLVETLARREEFAEAMGSRSLVEGSEHVFADCAESVLARPLARGALVCLGVVLMLELQGKDGKPAKQFLHWLNVAWQPEKIGISDPELARVLGALKEFDREHDRGHTVIREAEISGKAMKTMMERMRDPLIKSSFQKRRD